MRLKPFNDVEERVRPRRAPPAQLRSIPRPRGRGMRRRASKKLFDSLERNGTARADPRRPRDDDPQVGEAASTRRVVTGARPAQSADHRQAGRTGRGCGDGVVVDGGADGGAQDSWRRHAASSSVPPAPRGGRREHTTRTTCGAPLLL